MEPEQGGGDRFRCVDIYITIYMLIHSNAPGPPSPEYSYINYHHSLTLIASPFLPSQSQNQEWVNPKLHVFFVFFGFAASFLVIGY